MISSIGLSEFNETIIAQTKCLFKNPSNNSKVCGLVQSINILDLQARIIVSNSLL